MSTTSCVATSLIQQLRHFFKATLPDHRQQPLYPLVDVVMSGLAIFGLKLPSLLQLDQQ